MQQTLDILFLQEGSEFLSSTDASSRDSADRTIIAWDFRSSAKISNQIFHVRIPHPTPNSLLVVAFPSSCIELGRDPQPAGGLGEGGQSLVVVSKWKVTP